MEVHHHHHSGNHHKKKWTEYLLEFFMLFLAVFLGFIAENYREDVVEHRRGIQYIYSFIEDVQDDIKTLSLQIPLFEEKIRKIDTLLFYFTMGSPDSAYRYFWEASWFYKFFANDRTMQQLKNAGGMRLIADKAVADSIMVYDKANRYIQIHIENALLPNSRELTNMEIELFDFTLIPGWGKGLPRNSLKYPASAKLLTYDHEKISRYINKLINAQRDYSSQLGYLKNLKSKALRLIDYLNEHYH